MVKPSTSRSRRLSVILPLTSAQNACCLSAILMPLGEAFLNARDQRRARSGTACGTRSKASWSRHDHHEPRGVFGMGSTDDKSRSPGLELPTSRLALILLSFVLRGFSFVAPEDDGVVAFRRRMVEMPLWFPKLLQHREHHAGGAVALGWTDKEEARWFTCEEISAVKIPATTELQADACPKPGYLSYEAALTLANPADNRARLLKQAHTELPRALVLKPNWNPPQVYMAQVLQARERWRRHPCT